MAKPLSLWERCRKFGPGIVTGAADDDPAGIATYTLAGAQFGYGFLWISWFLWPFVGYVQLMCAEVALVTRKSLTATLCQKLPRPFVFFLLFLLFSANTLNIAADFAGMADAVSLISGLNSTFLVFLLAGITVLMIVFFNYQQIARTLVWLAFFLLAYVAAAFQGQYDWAEVGHSLLPSLPRGQEGWSMAVALLGTTISPYLFFWQSSQELEELHQLKGYKRNFHCIDTINIRKWDVGLGTFMSNLIMFFVILTAGNALFKAGIHHVQTSKEAASAWRPLLGNGAVYFYTIGLLGVGLLAIPTLSGSGAFAISDFFHWCSGLDRKWRQAPAFYGVILFSTALAVVIDLAGFNPIRALFWSAVANGIAAPPLLAAALLVATDKKLMKGKPINTTQTVMIAITTAFMTAAVFFFFAQLLK
jgi:Mn2+/Fe2+ NRAMP family transporter